MKLWLISLLALLWLVALSESAREKRGNRWRQANIDNMRRYVRRLEGCLHSTREKYRAILNCCVFFDGVCHANGTSFSTDDGCHRCTCASNSLVCSTTPGTCITACPSLKEPVHGDLSINGLGVGDTANVTCDTGYELTGTAVRTCSASGWNGTAANCVPVSCQPLANITNGMVIAPVSPVFEDEAVYSCNTGYTLDGYNRRCCNSSGEWNGVTPTCGFGGCGDLPVPDNGDIIYTGHQLGDNASVSCDLGFELNDTGSWTCIVSGWDGSSGSCVRVSCPPLSNPGNGTVSVEDGTEFEDEAIYTCGEGYELVGSNHRVCGSDGSWTSTEPMCVFIGCGDLPVPDNGDIIYTGHQLGDNASVSCDLGFELNDTGSWTCIVSGWDGSSGSCVRVSCPPLSNPGNGTVSVEDGTEFEDEAIYTCGEGYELVGSNHRVCGSDGSWTSTEPMCVFIDVCPTLQNPVNGIVNISGPQAIGSTAYYDCDCAHVSGKLVRYCLTGGVWSGTQPTCSSDGGEWYLAYENDASGNPVSGSKADLIDKLQNGADIRVQFTNGNQDYFTSVQNAILIGNEVCAQAPHHISLKSFTEFQPNAYWWFVYVCTSSHWQMSRYYVGANDFVSGSSASRFALKWFVRDNPTQRILSVNSAGAITTGSVDDVVDAVDRGHSIRLAAGSYYLPLYSLQYNSDKSVVSGTDAWALADKDVTRNGFQIKDFEKPAYWLFKLYATNGLEDAKGWLVGEHTNISDSIGVKSTDWFRDSCWRRLYQHSETGTDVHGNVSDLIDAIEAGHAIKMLSDGVLLEADTIYVTGNQVCASFINDLSRTSIDALESDSLKWVWKLCCTDGTKETITYNVGGTTKSFTTETASMTWFKDMKDWTKAVSVDENGNVQSGSKADLIAAIRKGSEVRMKVLYNGYTVYRQADNVKIANDEVSLMHVRSIIEDSATPSFSGSNTAWHFTLLTTLGTLDISRWEIGVHTSRSHNMINVQAEYFVNESRS